MDTAVAIVQAYLHLNGYFTVTEYPVIEAMKRGGYRAATDLDLLAFRFPRAGRIVPSRGRSETHDVTIGAPDPELGVEPAAGDMIIGEVKEGRAELNRGARNPAVLRAALIRFGCCDAESAAPIVNELLTAGAGTTSGGHRVRLLAFGATSSAGGAAYQTMTLGHVVRFVQAHLREHWSVLHHAQFKHPGLGFLMTLEKALQQEAGT